MNGEADTPPFDPDAPTGAWDLSSVEPSARGAEPTRIGPYRILEGIGQGGMGTVYLAEQTDELTRRVALKLIKLGMDSAQVIARFELERQALAVMSHDAIAKVFDAGTTERGQPYFVMEYVDGEPLDRFVTRHRLSLEQRLRLFQRICDGVQHAHQKGVIHRDLKPGNILVCLGSDTDTPTPKIIDFGLARATDQQLVDGSLFSVEGALLGTPEYMAPEQARGDVAAIDSRTDVYALGTILYELLTGDLPFPSVELRAAGLAEIQRRIAEDEPPKPSARVSTITDGERPSTAAGERHTTTASSSRDLRGDLDWIVMKALAKEPERRYESAAAFAADVERHLVHEPVLAGPPSASYRIAKFARRYRVQVVAGVLLLLALAAGVTGTLVYAFEADEKAELAATNEGLAKQEAAAAERARADEESQRLAAERAADETRVALARLAAREGQWDTALEQLDAVLASDTQLDPFPLRILRVELLGSAGRQTEAEIATSELLSDPEATAYETQLTMIAAARKLVTTKNPIKAATELEKLLDEDIDPRHRAWIEALTSTGLTGSVDGFRRAHELSPYDSVPIQMLTMLIGSAGRDEDIVRWATRLEALKPGSDEALTPRIHLALRGRGDLPAELSTYRERFEEMLTLRAQAGEMLVVGGMGWTEEQREAAKSRYAVLGARYVLEFGRLAGLMARENGVKGLTAIPFRWQREITRIQLRERGGLFGLDEIPTPQELADEYTAALAGTPLAATFISRAIARFNAGDLLGAEADTLAGQTARFTNDSIGPSEMLCRARMIEVQVEILLDPETEEADRIAVRERLDAGAEETYLKFGHHELVASWIALHYAAIDDFDRARAYALLYVAREPGDSRGAHLLARLELEVGNFDAADRWLTTAEELGHDEDVCLQLRLAIEDAREK